MRSIVRQIVIVTLAAQVLLATCPVTVLLLHERSTRYRALDTLLQGRADSLAGAIQNAEDTDAKVFVDPREFRSNGQDLYVVYGDTGNVIGSSSDVARRTSPLHHRFATDRRCAAYNAVLSQSHAGVPL